MMQRSTRVETTGIKCTLIRMCINVRSKVGVVKFLLLLGRDRDGAIAYIDARAIVSPSTGILIALYPTGIAAVL